LLRICLPPWKFVRQINCAGSLIDKHYKTRLSEMAYERRRDGTGLTRQIYGECWRRDPLMKVAKVGLSLAECQRCEVAGADCTVTVGRFGGK